MVYHHDPSSAKLRIAVHSCLTVLSFFYTLAIGPSCLAGTHRSPRFRLKLSVSLNCSCQMTTTTVVEPGIFTWYKHIIFDRLCIKCPSNRPEDSFLILSCAEVVEYVPETIKTNIRIYFTILEFSTQRPFESSYYLQLQLLYYAMPYTADGKSVAARDENRRKTNLTTPRACQ